MVAAKHHPTRGTRKMSQATLPAVGEESPPRLRPPPRRKPSPEANEGNPRFPGLAVGADNRGMEGRPPPGPERDVAREDWGSRWTVEKRSPLGGDPNTMPRTITALALGGALVALSLRLAVACSDDMIGGLVILAVASVLLGSVLGVRAAKSPGGQVVASLFMGFPIWLGLGLVWLYINFEHCITF